jgi:hypothetical protein
MRRSPLVPDDPPKGSEIHSTPCMHKPLSMRMIPFTFFRPTDTPHRIALWTKKGLFRESLKMLLD